MTNNKVKQNRKYALLAGTLLFSAGILGSTLSGIGE